MKKLIALLLLSIIPCSLKADSQSFGGNWGGLNNGDSSILIGDNEAQDLLNVDITDNGYGIKKRSGFSQFKTVGNSTWGVRGSYYFKDVAGNEELIAANQRSIYKSVNSSAFSAFVTTDTEGSYYDFTDSNGYLWRANSSRDEILRYDGTTVTYYPSFPKGNQIEAMPDRLVIAGTSANPNRVYFSGAADFTNFTTGINDTDPFTEDFGLPGQQITAIKYAFGSLLVWTNSTMSYWEGTGQFDGIIQDLSVTVGCIQPNSVIYDNGIVYWQAQDRHFYSYDGSKIERISRKITATADGLASGNVRAYTITTQSDWNSGSLTNSLSTSYSPGDINLATTTTIDDFSDGNLTSNPVWTSLGGGGTWSVTSGALQLANTGTGTGDVRYASVASFSTGTLSFSINGWTLQGATDNQFLKMCTSVVASTAVSSADNCYSIEFSYSSGSRVLNLYRQTTLLGTFSGVSQPNTSKTITLSRTTTGYFSITYDGTERITATDTTFSSFTYVAAGGQRSGGAGAVNQWDNITFYPSLGVYISTPISLGTAITAWGPFDANQNASGGSIDYAIYVDTDTTLNVNSASSFISSQAVTVGGTPSISVNQYITFVSTLSRTSSSQIPTISDVSINWYEGSITRSFVAVDKNQRILWAVAESTQSSPNITMIYDPRFSAWLKYSFPLQSPSRVGDSLYFGGVSTGVVYSYPSSSNDNASAITAYWKTKDFIGGDPFTEKDYTNLSLVAKTQTGSSLSVDSYINGLNSPFKTFTVSLSNSSSLPYIRFNDRFPAGSVGTLINFKLGNTSGDSPFEFYSSRYEYTPKAWRVLP